MQNDKMSIYTDPKSDREMKRKDVIKQMLTGAAVAAFVFFGPVAFIVMLAYAGTFLPPESKEAVDPTPDSFSSAEES